MKFSKKQREKLKVKMATEAMNGIISKTVTRYKSNGEQEYYEFIAGVAVGAVDCAEALLKELENDNKD